MTRHAPIRTSHDLPKPGPLRRHTARFAIVLGLALSGLAGQASAQTVVNFDDLGASTIGTQMPAAYAGLSFVNTNWHYMTQASAPAQVFLALNGSASSLRKVDGSGFYFDGADFWSRRSLDASGNFYYVLSYKGKVVYDGRNDRQGRMRFGGAPTLLRPSYTGPVDYVAIAFDKPGRGGDWDQLAMDNVRLRPL